MAEMGKRVEVRYGAFACRIEGYEDPAEQMRGILAVMRQAISETPALVDEGGLDEAQIARIEQALSDRRGAEDESVPGLVVLRSGDDAAEGGDTLPDGPEAIETHPVAAVMGVPAAAAEAAFAAEIAAEDESAEEEALSGSVRDAGPDTGSDAAARPADGAFAVGATGTAPADPDDDAEDADSVDAEEALEARAQISDPRGAPAADHRLPYPEEAEREAVSSRSREGSWGAPGAAARPEEPSPFVNIFAPPPTALRAGAPAEAEPAVSLFAVPEPLASLRREPGPAAADAADGAGQPRAADATDEAFEDEDGAWDDPQDADDPERDGDEPRTAENRFAALITRYQNARMRPAGEAAPRAGLETSMSAAELAERAGAEEVTDLLATSAAWLTLADGRPRFSRREVMEVFETLPGDHPRTLEARIKGFGQLVRSGTIVLVDQGTFSLSQDESDRFRTLIGQR